MRTASLDAAPVTTRGLAVPVLLVLLAGCTAAVPVPPAPSAPDPACAEVARQVPSEVAGLERRETTAQAAQAWGPGTSAADAATGPAVGPAVGEVVARCGVDPPGPTTTACTSVVSEGVEIDWISATSPSGSRFTTYGRRPAVTVTIPSSLTDADPTIAQSVLADLAPAVASIPAERRCTAPDAGADPAQDGPTG